MLNLVLAAFLAVVATYSDLKYMKIYNKQILVFFGLGLLLVFLQGQYFLLISFLIVLAIYIFLYSGGRVMSKMAINIGLLPIPDGKKPVAGGDVKLAATMALLLGHFPVLYGTLAGVLLMALWQGIKLWRVSGSASAVADVALGRANAPAPFSPFLGVCSICAAVFLYGLQGPIATIPTALFWFAP